MMMQQMMKKLQEMQQQLQVNMAKAQEELGTLILEGEAGGGKVKVKCNGHQEVQSVTIDPTLIDPEQAEMLEDLVLTAVRDAITRSKKVSAEKMASLSQGLPIPPGLF